MLIRVEIPIDAPGIDALLRRNFDDEREAERVKKLREDGLLTLGLVATDDDGQVVGYVAFSPVTVDGDDRQWVGLAPLAVDDALRGQGVAKGLVYEGLDALNEFGYRAVVTLGTPQFYQRLGFKPALTFGFHCQSAESEMAFQIYPLADDALTEEPGRVEYAPHFSLF